MTFKVDLRRAKASAADNLRPGAPGREVLLGLADEVEEGAFDLLLPSLLRVLRLRTEAP
jgi:hypothetical protein